MKCDARRYLVIGPLDIFQELATMNFLASMRRWNDANIAASSGPVLRHHLTHPRTLNQNLGAPALPSVCPPPKLTSPAVVVAVLAEDAALGVGDRWRVTNAMPAGS